jgi:subtilase family serine protease
MNISKISAVLSVAVISVVASNAMAANPNGPKPNCPLGQLPVLENGFYHCEEAKLKSNASPSRQTATTPQLKKAKAVLPDYTIMSAKRKMGTTATFQVKVRNAGTGAAPQGVLFGQHFLKNNQSWGADAIIPPLAAGQTKVVVITIPPENYERGDRMIFTADYFKKIVESNENNNVYSMNYK